MMYLSSPVYLEIEMLNRLTLSAVSFLPITAVLGFLISLPAMSQTTSNNDVAVRDAAGLNEADAQIADILREMARKEEAGTDIDYGRLEQFWCDAAHIAPTPENLEGCARGTYGAFVTASNPPATRQETAQISLGFLNAGLKIIDAESDLLVDLRSSMNRDALCLSSIVNNTEKPSNCAEPYDR